MTDLRPGQRVVLVAAHARNRVIGNGPDIPWRLPGEQAQFKELTWGHTLLMGRTTFESIGRPAARAYDHRAHPARGWTHDGVLVAHTVEEALDLAGEQPAT